jgi:hypothetical protein
VSDRMGKNIVHARHKERIKEYITWERHMDEAHTVTDVQNA